MIILKKEEALNQQLDEQLKAGLIMESKSRYAVPCFYILKKDGSLQLVQNQEDKENGNKVHHNTGQQRNCKEARQNKPRGSTGVYLTIYTSIQ